MDNFIEKVLVESDAILEKEIKPFGTTCHILVPKEHEGKTAKIIIYKKEKEKKE